MVCLFVRQIFLKYSLICPKIMEALTLSGLTADMEIVIAIYILKKLTAKGICFGEKRANSLESGRKACLPNDRRPKKSNCYFDRICFLGRYSVGELGYLLSKNYREG